MFDKKAEEIANKRCHEIMCYGHCSFNSPKHHRCGEWHREYNCAKEGIEYGYSQANDWQFVKDGKYPKDENKICLLYLGDMFNPITGWYKNGCWCFEDDRNENIWQDYVIAWKEIVLPELPKESEDKCRTL